MQMICIYFNAQMFSLLHLGEMRPLLYLPTLYTCSIGFSHATLNSNRTLSWRPPLVPSFSRFCLGKYAGILIFFSLLILNFKYTRYGSVCGLSYANLGIRNKLIMHLSPILLSCLNQGKSTGQH